MTPGLSIRFATQQDLSLVEQLAQQIWPVTYKDILSPDQLAYMMNLIYSPAALERQFTQEKQHFLIAELDSNPVGFASFSRQENPGVYKLHKIYVHPSTQGKGLGKSIIDFITQYLKNEKATTLLLNVNRYNKAKSFYEKLGFTVIGEEDIDIGSNYFMNDYVMKLEL